MSLGKATLPKDWKTGKVCPVFKKGDKYSPANYRPVSLTSVLEKQLEHIITTGLMSDAKEKNLLYYDTDTDLGVTRSAMNNC